MVTDETADEAALENEVISRVLEPTDDVVDFMPSLAKNDSDQGSQLIFKQNLPSEKLFQGDMLLLPDQEEFFFSNETDDESGTRTGILQLSYRWPKNRQGYVTLFYEIAPRTYSS